MRLSKNITWVKLSPLILVSVLLGMFSCNHSQQVQVLFQTEKGEIIVEVDCLNAPHTTSNFLALVRRGIYTNALFYRVVRMDNQPQNKVKIEVIQGGLFDDDLINNYSPIEHETTEVTGIKHTDGVISMARNEPGSASTEFFICVGDQPSLDFGGDRNPDGEGFAAFGKVVQGMDVVRAIQSLPDSGQYLNNPIVIREIEVFR